MKNFELNRTWWYSVDRLKLDFKKYYQNLNENLSEPELSNILGRLTQNKIGRTIIRA